MAGRAPLPRRGPARDRGATASRSSNLRLVGALAAQFVARGLPLSDLVQEGNLGLMKAVNRFDPERGTRFSTYAAWWVRQSMRRALQDQVRTVRIPVHMQDAAQRVTALRRRLTQTLGRAPTADELLRASGLESRKLEAIGTQLAGYTVSLDQPYEDPEEGRSLHEVLDAGKDDDALALEEQLTRAGVVRQALHLVQELEPRERDVICRRFGLEDEQPLTLGEIGELYGLSRERIRQIECHALKKLRELMRSGGAERAA